MILEVICRRRLTRAACCLSFLPPGQYPSSAQQTRDWDKVVVEISEEEKKDKPEGDAALNSLFQQIYSDGSDEVKRAMNKSFVSSTTRVRCQHTTRLLNTL